jgi:Epoxide hydrolase N terminus
MLERVLTPTSEPVPIPIGELFPWLVFAGVLLLAIYFVGVEEGATAIFPGMYVNVPEAELTELRRRVKATKWPERETVTDASQGVQLATIQELARYWATEYDWRKVEARLNALPHTAEMHPMRSTW